MRIRLKTRWAKDEREISLEESVSVLAFNGWKIAMQALLDIENEDFQVDSQMQRIAILEETSAFLIHITDRMAYDKMGHDNRAILITEYARKMADHVHENAREFGELDDYRKPFVNKLNQRMSDYAETSWNTEENKPGFSMGRVFGNVMTDALGPRDRKWVLDYIQQVEMPEILKAYNRAIRPLGLV